MTANDGRGQQRAAEEARASARSSRKMAARYRDYVTRIEQAEADQS